MGFIWFLYYTHPSCSGQLNKPKWNNLIDLWIKLFISHCIRKIKYNTRTTRVFKQIQQKKKKKIGSRCRENLRKRYRVGYLYETVGAENLKAKLFYKCYKQGATFAVPRLSRFVYFQPKKNILPVLRFYTFTFYVSSTWIFSLGKYSLRCIWDFVAYIF